MVGVLLSENIPEIEFMKFIEKIEALEVMRGGLLNDPKRV